MTRRKSYKVCDDCGRTFDSLGLPNHRANCKGRLPAAPPPSRVDVWPFPKPVFPDGGQSPSLNDGGKNG